MVRVRAIGRHIHHQRHRTPVIKEADGDTGITTVVRGSKASIKVRQKVDRGAIIHAWSEDTWNLDTDVGLGVVPNDGGVDNESQERVLVGRVVFFKKSGGVVVTYRSVRWALRDGGADGSEESECFQLHRAFANRVVIE